MPRKLTYEFVKTAFKEEGYKLLSKKYTGSSQKLGYLCSERHRHSMTWEVWKSGRRCPYCAGNAKKTIKEIKKSFEQEGYKLLSKQYRGYRKKLKYICLNGHKHEICWDNWRGGQRCFYCVGNVKKTVKEIEKNFEKDGYKLLTKKYENGSQKLKYLCPRGHQHSIRWYHWNKGVRCPTCFNGKKTTIMKQCWGDPVFQQKVYKALNLKPNKPETLLLNLLNQLFPNEYKYVGDFQFFLGGKNPDFLNVNSQKKLIEIFGIHWHSPKMTGLSRKEHERERIMHFKKFSFDTLIIWEDELKDQETLINKLQTFHNIAQTH